MLVIFDRFKYNEKLKIQKDMKYYLYIDECGDNNLKNFDEQFPIFTLCGIVVSEDKREWLEKEVQALKVSSGEINKIIPNT